MAAPRYGLGAHQDEALASGPGDEVCETVREFRGLHVVGVTAEGHVAPSRIRGPRVWAPESSQAGNVFIPDAGGRERGRQSIAVDRRVVPRAWHGAHVNKPSHRVGP